MKEFIAIAGAVILGIFLVGLMVGTGGSTTGSLAGSANSVVERANTQINSVFP